MKATAEVLHARFLWAVAFLLISCASCGGTATGSVGAVLGKQAEDGRLYIRQAPPGMAAWTAGLEPDDEVVAIDGRDVKAMTLDDVRAALRGPVDSTVVLTIRRGGVVRDVKVKRGPFKEGA